MKRYGFRKIALWIGLIGLSSGWYYWRQQESVQPLPYLTAVVVRGDIEASVLASGTIEALKQVDVGAQVSGEISKLYVKLGDTVKSGTLIAEIDAGTQVNNRNTARAQLASREAALESAQAVLREAEQNNQRQRGLFRRGAAAKEAVEKASAALQSARAAVRQARAAVETGKIELNTAGLNLGHTSVRAPIDGTVVAVLVEQGQTVNAIQNVPTLVKIAQTNTMKVRPKISEADVNKVRAGMPVYFSLLGNPKARFDSTLRSIDPAPIAVSDNRASDGGAVYYYGNLFIANPKQQLRIGMTANISIVIQRAKDALLVPMTAIRDDSEGHHVVDVISGGKVIPRRITLGIEDGIHAQVLTGLAAGEQVVVSESSSTSNASEGAL